MLNDWDATAASDPHTIAARLNELQRFLAVSLTPDGKVRPEATPAGTAQRGDQGLRGDKGERGDPGPAGAQGQQGERGQKGEEGKEGPPGKQGPVGAAGVASTVPGPKGEQGPRGLAGEPGVRGPVGPRGQTGAPCEPEKWAEIQERIVRLEAALSELGVTLPA